MFLSLAGYYHKFVCNFGLIAQPLTHLLRKDSLFVWTSEHAIAFDILKMAPSLASMLSLPDFSQPFHIEIDASGTSVGAMLH